MQEEVFLLNEDIVQNVGGGGNSLTSHIHIKDFRLDYNTAMILKKQTQTVLSCQSIPRKGGISACAFILSSASQQGNWVDSVVVLFAIQGDF